MNGTFPEEVSVAVIGAGPTGLVTSALFAKLGIDCLTVDRKPGITNRSKAVGIQARTLEQFERLGIAHEVARRGRPIEGAVLYRDGRKVSEIYLGEAGIGLSPYPYILALRQSDTESILSDVLHESGGAVQWRSSVESIRRDDDGVWLEIERDGATHRVRADWVVGADGASSPTRKAMDLSFEGGTYENRFCLIDGFIDGDIPEERVTIDLLGDGIVAIFPLPGERQFRVIASIPEELEDREFDDAEVVAMVRAQMSFELDFGVPEWTSTYRLHHRMAERFRVGRCFVAGDAAHIHSPVGGQGMNTGIADAFNLAWKMARVIRGADADLLDSYCLEREPFAHQLLESTDRAFSAIAAPTMTSSIFRRRIAPTLASAAWSSERVRREVFTRVSQIGITYAGGPLAFGEEFDGAPVPGDRAPNAPWSDGTRLFDHIDSLDHHLLAIPGVDLPSADELVAALGAFGEEIEWIRPDGSGGLGAIYGAQNGGVRLIRPDGYLAVVGNGEAALPALEKYAKLMCS